MDRRQQQGLAVAWLWLACAPLACAQEAAPSPTAKPSPAVTPSKPVPSEDPIAASRRAERKERREQIEMFLDGKGGDAPINKLLEHLPPEADREAFRKNLMRWRDLPPQERDALRGQMENRDVIKAEIDKTIRDSGLHLSADQREVYALRYMQERRKLERSLRDQMGSERARRLPGIVESLKKEFTSPSPAPAVSPTPAPKTPTPTASPTPAVS